MYFAARKVILHLHEKLTRRILFCIFGVPFSGSFSIPGTGVRGNQQTEACHFVPFGLFLKNL